MKKRILSDFHYTYSLINGACFGSNDAFHSEFSLKLGFPTWYGRNWDALLECLSSIGDSGSSLCSHWEWRDGKKLVLAIQGFSLEKVDPSTLLSFLQVMADANNRLTNSKSLNRVWMEFDSPSQKMIPLQ